MRIFACQRGQKIPDEYVGCLWTPAKIRPNAVFKSKVEVQGRVHLHKQVTVVNLYFPLLILMFATASLLS